MTMIRCTIHTAQVVYREGTGHGQGSTGTGWSSGLGKMRNISIGSQVDNCLNSVPTIPIVILKSVWGLNRADEVFVRIGLSKEDTKGKDWTKIEGSMRNIR